MEKFEGFEKFKKFEGFEMFEGFEGFEMFEGFLSLSIAGWRFFLSTIQTFQTKKTFQTIVLDSAVGIETAVYRYNNPGDERGEI